MKRTLLARTPVGALLLPLLAFAFGQSVEFAHPIEEAATDQHQHSVPTAKESVRCDGGEHPHHSCVHSTALAAGFQPPQFFSNRLEPARPLIEPELVRVACTAVPLQRGPPQTL